MKTTLADKSTLFMAPCPKCSQLRLQSHYDRDSLLRLLNRGHPVEAHCERCDEFWAIGGKARAGLAAAVMAGGGERVESIAIPGF